LEIHHPAAAELRGELLPRDRRSGDDLSHRFEGVDTAGEVPITTMSF
jgi:hypothetical protein